MLANLWKEGKSGIIELAATRNEDQESSETDGCDDPEVVKLMMDYFYYFDYESQDSDTPLKEHAQVFAMAVKYQVNGLRDLAATKFAEVVKKSWNTAEFPRAVHIVHHSTAEDTMQLRTIVADTLHEHFDDLKYQAEVETVVGTIPGLAYRLLKRSRAPQASSICQLQAHKECEIKEILCPACIMTSRFCSGCYNKGGYADSPRCPRCTSYARFV